jgi:Fe-S-cluster containining protein
MQPLTCDECSGACCQFVSTPPGLFPIFASPKWDGLYMADTEDYIHWASMPAALQDELRAVYAERREDGQACVWLHEGRCKHYVHRPEACRNAVTVGDAACLEARDQVIQLNLERLQLSLPKLKKNS